MEILKLHQKIRAVRNAKHFSQTEVAKRINMSITTYNMKEMGYRPIRSEEFEQIALALEEKPEIFYAENFHLKWNTELSTL